MPVHYPPWNDQTIEQKLAFVHEWLMNVERAMGAIGARIQGLDDRLQRVEVANAQRPRAETLDNQPC